MTNDFSYSELNSSKIELTDVPLIIRKAVLMSQGIWNNVFYGKNEIEKAFKVTDWGSREKSNLFLDHKDYEASEWIGEVRNKYFKGDTLYGDLIVYDPIWASKLKYGKPKVGISPKVGGSYDDKNKSMHNFTFDNFSLVINPAVKTAFINNMEVMKVDEKEIEKVLAEGKDEPEEEDPEKKKDEVMSEEDRKILKAAKSVLAAKKKDIENPEKEDEEMADDVFSLFENLILKGKDVGEITKKANEIRDKKESFKSAIRRAAKMAEDEEKPEDEEEEKKEAPAPTPAPAAEGDGEKKEEDDAESVLKEKLASLEKRIETMSKAMDAPIGTSMRRSTKELSEKELDQGLLDYLNKMDRGEC